MLLQTDLLSAEGFIKVAQTFGVGIVLVFFVIWVVYKIIMMENERKQEMNHIASALQKTQDRLVAEQAENNKRLEDKLDSTQQAFEAERKSWDAERKTFLDERERLKQELERSLNNEADMALKIKALNDDIDILRKRVGDLETERELDKIEKKQILDESAKIKEQNKVLNREKGEALRSNQLLEQLIAQQSERISNMEKRIDSLEQAVKTKDHELSKAHGTIVTLTDRLMKLTDDTQKIPPFEDIENAGDEVVTPVLNMDLNIEEAEATTIIEVTATDDTVDNTSNDDDNIIEDKSA